jgi:hypothetical protein
MATNKHASIRYQTLNNCFRNPGRNYYIEDLIKACNDAIYDYLKVLEFIKPLYNAILYTNVLNFSCKNFKKRNISKYHFSLILSEAIQESLVCIPSQINK